MKPDFQALVQETQTAVLTKLSLLEQKKMAQSQASLFEQKHGPSSGLRANYARFENKYNAAVEQADADLSMLLDEVAYHQENLTQRLNLSSSAPSRERLQSQPY